MMAGFSLVSSRALLLALCVASTAIVTYRGRRKKDARKEEEVLTNTEYGFKRAELGTLSLPGTVDTYNRHFFVISGKALQWPARWEESEGLPQGLCAAMKAHKSSMPFKIRLTAAEGIPEAGDEEGDVLVYPDLIRIRGLKIDNVEDFVKTFLLAKTDVQTAAAVFGSGNFQISHLPPASVFICTHMKRDARCGYGGSYLVKALRQSLTEHHISAVDVRACSHVGGHKYAGNVIIFSRRDEAGVVIGDWYGYVTPDLVTELVESHIIGDKVLVKHWRGQMGKTVDEQVEWAGKCLEGSCKDCPCKV